MNRVLTVAAAICFAFSLAIQAQTPTAATQQNQSNPQEISAQRRALAKELVDVIDVRKGAKDMFDVLEAELQKETIEMTWQALSQMKEMKDLTDIEQQEIRDKIKENSERGFKRFVESLNRRVDFGQLTEDVSINIYAKHFNEKELADLIAFYKSDTGKRSMELAPTLLGESMAQTNERLMPLMNDIMHDIAGDDATKFRGEVIALAKSHHRQPATQRRQTSRPKN